MNRSTKAAPYQAGTLIVGARFEGLHVSVLRALVAYGLAETQARALVDKKLADYDAKIALYEKEKADIKKSAEGFQQEYDRLNVHDDQFDMAEALLSVAIALFGVTALTRKAWLLYVAIGFAGFGTMLGVAGFVGWSLHPDWLARILG